MNLIRSAATGALIIASAVACRGGDADDAPSSRVDTTNTDALDGLSSQEVEAKAEALTPEQAAARGIVVDSTIHVENLSSTDSTPPGAAPVEPGRTPSPPARPDSAR
jgi:hypothetical protein